MSKRIYWLDGLKGLACIAVICHHFLLGFMPATYFGDATMSHMDNQLDVAMAQAPYSVFFNGNFMVAVFCLVSGLVLSRKVMALEKKEELSSIVIKRYPRLVLPVAPIIILVFFMLKWDMFSNMKAAVITHSGWLSSYYGEAVDKIKCIEGIFVTTWFSKDYTFSNAFWMLNQLFLGSFLAIILSVMSWKSNKKIMFVYIFIAILYIRINTFGLAFVLGVILAYMSHEFSNCLSKQFLGVISVIVGLFLGGYPSGIEPDNVYRYLSIFPETVTAYQFWHIIGAFLLVFGIWNVGVLKKLLEKRIVCFLGKISYAAYIIHIPLIYSFSSSLFCKVWKLKIGYCKTVAITFLITICVVLLLSYLYQRYVERFCDFIINKLFHFITVQ